MRPLSNDLDRAVSILEQEVASCSRRKFEGRGFTLARDADATSGMLVVMLNDTVVARMYTRKCGNGVYLIVDTLIGRGIFMKFFKLHGTFPVKKAASLAVKFVNRAIVKSIHLS